MSLSQSAQQFLDSVLALNLKLAVFDCDGTLWDADSGEQFFYWELERAIMTSSTGRAPATTNIAQEKSPKNRCAVKWSPSIAGFPVT